MGRRRDDSIAVPPSGTVTFLFTDVEGSTVRWERDPDVMSSALNEHDSMMRSTIEGNGGFVFSTGGDGFSVTEPSPSQIRSVRTQATLPDAEEEGARALGRWEHPFLVGRMAKAIEVR